MARMDRTGFDQWIVVAQRWVRAAFGDGDSLFTPGNPIWTVEPLDQLHERFVDQADDGDEDFRTKLAKQLDGAAANVVQLMAELLYGYYLPVLGGVNPQTQVDSVEFVAALAVPPVAVPDELKETLKLGIARAAQSYNQQRYQQLRFILEAARAWWAEDQGLRDTTLADPWAFKAWLAKRPLDRNWAARQMLMYMAFPDTFEPIMARVDRDKIARALATPEEQQVQGKNRQLLAIRERLTPDRKEGFSFYEADLKAIWKPKTPEADDGDAVDRDTAPKPGPRYWKIAPGANAEHWDDCRARGVIGCGWREFGDVSDLTRTQFIARADELMAEHDWSKACRQVWTLAKAVRPGDLVLANHGKKRIVGVGRVTGPYVFDGNASLPHQLPVDWYDTTPRTMNELGWQKTIIEMSREKFESLVGAPPPTPPAVKVTSGPVPIVEPFRLLRDRLNVLLYGPPGTGKTRATLMLAEQWRAWQGADSVFQVTFHPSFSYEDFIEGFRPDKSGVFGLRHGLFRQVCDAALREPDRQFLLVIDELNRGDVARIFGELITLIERDKRHPSAARKLPYSGDAFYVPANLHLLGTMNTADRSISLLDVAIRRRFCFVETPPDPTVLDGAPEHASVIAGVQLGALLAAVNRNLALAGVDRDRAIGHSYLLVADGADSLAALRDRLRYDVLPLVEEYCYADRSRIASVLGALVTTTGDLNSAVFDDDDRLTKALQSIYAVAG